MKTFLFTQEGIYVGLINYSSADSFVVSNRENLIEYPVDDNFEFSFDKKYSLIDGELVIEDSPMVPPPEVVEPELTPEQKLESSGLTVDELKQLLGL